MRVLRLVFAWVFAPVFFFGFLALGVRIVEAGAHEIWLAPLLLSALGLSFACEQLLPYEPVWNRRRGDLGRDIVHALVNETATVAAVASVPALLALSAGLHAWPAGWPLALQLGLAILVADFGITIVHYASHRFEPLWRLHAVHHSVGRMYGLNGLMKHPLHQTLETIAGTTPLVLLGVPPRIGALLGLAVALQLFLQHSNVDMRVGCLGYVWAVAPGHRHHHLASTTDGDVNFGLFTMVWDHLLGTFVTDRPMPRDGQIGVAGRPDFPFRWAAQIVEPFRRLPPRSAKEEETHGG